MWLCQFMAAMPVPVLLLFCFYGGEMLVNDLNAINTMEHHAPAPDITILSPSSLGFGSHYFEDLIYHNLRT